MLAVRSHLLVLHVLRNHFQEDLPYHCPRDGGEADYFVVPYIFLLE